MFIEEKQLKTFITDANLVSGHDLERAEREAKENKGDLGEVLVNQGKITEDDLRRIQAYILGIPFVDLRGVRIDFDTLSLIPEPVARTWNIVAYKRSDKGLEVAMLDADDLRQIDFIKKKVALKILPRLTSRESIKSALLQYQKSLKAEFGDIVKREAAAVEERGERVSDLSKLSDELPVVRIVDTLLKHALIQNASDVHIEPGESELLVRYRIDGILHDAMVLPKTVAPAMVARIKVLSNLKLDEKRLPQDGRFKMDINGEKISFRVSVLPVYFGEKVAMRLLREAASGFSLEGIGFHGEAMEHLHQAVRQKVGLLLTTGPTGSGKTTTLYTLIDILNTRDINISTIEDPIEYQIPRVNQTQVKPDIGFSFANGLRSLVRQDPDIIMVGEIRDNETAGLAINAALTGHLVLSTLHTNSASGAMPRLLDMKVEPFLLVSTVNAVIGQRLVRRLTESREKYFLSKSELGSLGRRANLERVLGALKSESIVSPGAGWDKIPFWKPRPTDEFRDGYSGRLCIHEVLMVSPAIRELVLKAASTEAVESEARKEGMLTMIEDGIFKAAAGVTTIEEVLRVASE
ncbi:MAG: type II/IV secretion system protein [Candidatus Taylorbacteria bacterium]|nr:type II/IV secretion system protein [Candidatus Taylorbacteria bacterium]